METMRDIERRIDTVENTKQITRAMKMVASAKLRRAQEKAVQSRPFFNRTREVLVDIVHNTDETAEHPLLEPTEGDSELYMLVTSDRGLCGSYNTKVIRRFNALASRGDQLVVLGRTGYRTFRRQEYEIAADYVDLDDYPSFWFARRVTDRVIDLYLSENIDRVHLIYTHFESALSQSVRDISLLPADIPTEKEEARVAEEEELIEQEQERPEEKSGASYLYEPTIPEVLDTILPQYLNNVLYSAILESKASEFGSRMTAMDNATENAEEMIDELTLSYNRARQEQITKEITEIVSGAEALQ
ncbi:ATP synthase F1 subunit gamma [Halarsenatibacter silvermanii]|uniref:ATP synthase gamma chain n=1 Tax=Halarsenatibacter silvermanii TaxID=321763 RepID=A0A1G9HVB5_9FIRM|nr:ATP synthase F1 subunit gamma [Halarsenatibacter silvermanii]SDL16792.1 ATP synthase F1 subcomplex gamma subunit [Halarsenatibacter silvermanii]